MNKIIFNLEMSKLICYIFQKNFLLHRNTGFLLQCCSKSVCVGEMSTNSCGTCKHFPTKAGSSLQINANVGVFLFCLVGWLVGFGGGVGEVS